MEIYLWLVYQFGTDATRPGCKGIRVPGLCNHYHSPSLTIIYCILTWILHVFIRLLSTSLNSLSSTLMLSLFFLSFFLFSAQVLAFHFSFNPPSECDDIGLTWTGALTSSRVPSAVLNPHFQEGPRRSSYISSLYEISTCC